ncbi:U32 family peptidase [bacterium]|nr:U32 family peptidase [bacterium]
MELVTFATNPQSLKIAVENGANQVLLEDSRFSLRSFTNDFFKTDFGDLRKTIWFAKENFPQTKLTFNLDLIAHNKHFTGIKSLLEALLEENVASVRVQDVGVAFFVRKNFPQFQIELATETGNNNVSSFKFYLSEFACKKIVATNELPFFEIARIKNEVSVEIEMQVQGPILIQYTGRRLMTGLVAFRNQKLELNPETAEPIMQKIVREKTRPNEFFPFYDNVHGNFMFYSSDKCLLELLPQIYEAKIDALLIDCRGENENYLAKSLQLYSKYTKLFEAKKFVIEPKDLEDLKKLARRPFTSGFFLANETDKRSRLNINHEANSFDGTLLTVDQQSSTIALETKTIFRTGDTLRFFLPTEKTLDLKVYKLTDILGNPLENAKTDGINLVNFTKGLISNVQFTILKT